MSRTRHHDKLAVSERIRRKKASARQRYLRAMRVDEWYAELPITKQVESKLSRRESAWS